MSLSLTHCRNETPPESSKSLSALEKLHNFFYEDLDQVNKLALERLQNTVPLASTVARHLILAGGKRIRPLLTLASAKLCDYKTGSRHIGLAACIEFIHTATLLHDDVIDDSIQRRGMPSANILWGNKTSVLVGDFLFSRAFELMVMDGSLGVLKILSQAASAIMEGEILQLSVNNTVDLPEQTYFEIITAKTARLFSAACEVGAVVALRSPRETKALAKYGLNLGIIFQLLDDLLDYTANTKKLGKTPGDDFRDGKVTLPVMLAYARGKKSEQDFWIRVFKEHTQEEQDFEHAVSLIYKHQIPTLIQEKAQTYGQKAQRALEVFPPSPLRETLKEVVTFCLTRQF